MVTLLKAHDVAQILNIRPATVYAMVHRGILPHVRLIEGKRRGLIRFRPEDVTQFIAEHAQGPRRPE